MSTRHTAPARLGLAWLRRRLVWTAVLLVVALGGAGLATAVDRPHSQAQRPELGWTADQRAGPWLAELLTRLERVEQYLAALSGSARQALSALSTLRAENLDAELAALEANIAAGDAFAGELSTALDQVAQIRAQQPDNVESWRLGASNRELLQRVDLALAAGQSLSGDWGAMRRVGQAGAGLAAGLIRHDELVLAAMAAGRDARWRQAVDSLERALPLLEQADEAAAELSAHSDGQTADLLARLRTHDEALLDLYGLLAETDSLDDPRVEPLRRRVEAARLPLPVPPQTLRAVMAETALPTLSAGLVALEEARGRTADALHPGEEEEEAPE